MTVSGYSYERERSSLFTEEGLALFTAIRDNVRAKCAEAGAVAEEEAIRTGLGGNSWMMLACLDLMIERGELHRIESPYARVYVLVRRLA